MKRVSFLVTLLLLAVPAAAWAGPGAAPDTSGVLPRWLQASLEAGVSWMQSPPVVSDRYSAGLALGGALSVQPASRVRVSAQLEYLDLPNGANGYMGTYQVSGQDTVATALYGDNAFGGGHQVGVLGVLSLRLWRNLWLEGGIGQGYFSSGYPDILFIDGVTGEYIPIPGETGWGREITAGAACEFTVGKRRHLFVSARWVRMERGDEPLEFVPLRLGVRFD